MKCSRMHLSERRYKPPPRVSKCESAPIIRPCAQRLALENPQNSTMQRFKSACRSISPHASTSSNSPESQKTPLMIVNLKISPDVKTLGSKKKSDKSLSKKPPPFCVQYQNSLNKLNVNTEDPNMKIIHDFIVQGRLFGNQRRHTYQKSHDSPDIVIDCDENELDECDTTMCESAVNVFNNINTDLLLSLDYYEMDNFGRLPGDSRANTPINIGHSNRATNSASIVSQGRSPTPTLLSLPPFYRPLSHRVASPNTHQIIRVDLVNRDNSQKLGANIKEIDYNLNRLKEKRGIRNNKNVKVA